jgi:adenylate cyclase
VDQDGYFYIDWCLPPNDPRLTKEPIERLLRQDNMRREGQTNGLINSFAGKLVVVGSTATGNDLTDLGATPLEKDTHLASAYWNVASSILTGRFVHRAPLEMELLLIVVMGILAALVTWQLRVLVASAVVVLSLVAYVALGTFLYVQHRYWLPLIFPVWGGLLMNHICLVTWRVVFEQTERRRIKNIFSHIVSPKIVNELLKTEALSLGGARREITVFFADVRGFTEFTDSSQEKASEYVRRHNLSGAAADAFFDEQARETLSTVSTYLALVAEMVIKHNGTLDKYIGDCVMAFWGAPTPDPIHALACVRAAVDAQRAVHELNLQRAGENKKREAENKIRLAAGETPRPLLPILSLGTGINTGAATVGLMGSDAHGSNYTVFGREVNLASRLESLSGRGRIVISETTCGHLLRDDPDLAATCVSLPDATQLKGFRAAVKVYEVPWRQFGEIPADQGVPTGFLTRDDLRR